MDMLSIQLILAEIGSQAFETELDLSHGNFESASKHMRQICHPSAVAAVVNPHGAFNPISCHLAWLTCRPRSMQYPLAGRWIVWSHKGGFSKQPMDASHMWQSTVFSGMRLSADQAYMHRLGHSLHASIMHACSIWAMWVHVQQRQSVQEAAVLPAKSHTSVG